MRQFLDEKKIRELIKMAEGNPRDFALLHLAASTAFRAGDLLALTRDQILDEDGRVVRVLRVKMQKVQRWIDRPLREDCRLAVFEWLSTRNDDNPYLFISQERGWLKRGRTGPMSRFGYDDVIKGYLKRLFPKSQLRGSSTHTLRRSVAKLVYKKTHSIAAAQYLLGHTSPVHTIRYLDPEEIKETADIALKELEY